tara:strand:+ start:288 stop:710 length:423 start_codon:yes stop_codon:yes gene_type:complete
MATTTATITLASSDLLSDALSLSATSTLYKASSTATGLDQVKMGRNEIPTGTNFDLLDATAAGVDKSNKVYIINKSTDPTYYVIVSILTEVIGRLYAGDWMFIPWNIDGATSDIEIEAVTGTNTVEWVMFHENETLATSG